MSPVIEYSFLIYLENIYEFFTSWTKSHPIHLDKSSQIIFIVLNLLLCLYGINHQSRGISSPKIERNNSNNNKVLQWHRWRCCQKQRLWRHFPYHCHHLCRRCYRRLAGLRAAYHQRALFHQQVPVGTSSLSTEWVVLSLSLALRYKATVNRDWFPLIKQCLNVYTVSVKLL